MPEVWQSSPSTLCAPTTSLPNRELLPLLGALDPGLLDRSGAQLEQELGGVLAVDACALIEGKPAATLGPAVQPPGEPCAITTCLMEGERARPRCVLRDTVLAGLSCPPGHLSPVRPFPLAEG